MPDALATRLPALSYIQAAWKPSTAFSVAQTRLRGTNPSTIVQAELQVPSSHAMVTQFVSLAPQAHLDEAVQTLLQTGQGEFPVVDGAGKPVGVLGRADLIRAIKTLGPDARVANAMTAKLPIIGHRRCLEDAFKVLQQKQAPAVGVTDAGGKLIGLVTGETIADMMMQQDAVPKGAQSGPWGRPAGN